MRIELVGDNEASRTLKGYIAHLGYAVVDYAPTFTFYLVEEGEDFIVDGVDSLLERRVLSHLEDLGAEKFILKRAGGVRSEFAIKIIYPAGKGELVARACARAMQEAFINQKPVEPPKKSIFRKLNEFLRAPIFLLLLASSANAQQFVYGRAWDSVNLAAVDSGDSTNRAIRVNVVASSTSGSDVNLVSINGTTLTGANVVDGGNTAFRVNCVVGCGSSSFSDNSAFTGGSTAINLLGALYDNTPPAITDGNAGIPRMNSSRILLVDGSTATQPVSGTVSLSPQTSIVTGQQSVTASAVALPSNTAKNICIRVLISGTQNVYFGPSGVTTSTGMELLPGDSWCGSIDNTNRVYVIASSTGSSVAYEARN